MTDLKTLKEAKIIARSSDPDWVGEELFRLQELARSSAARVAELEAMVPVAWRALTDAQRLELIGMCCRGCGSLDTGCQCWNDD